MHHDHLLSSGSCCFCRSCVDDDEIAVRFLEGPVANGEKEEEKHKLSGRRRTLSTLGK
jgi:hypothetical protein